MCPMATFTGTLVHFTGTLPENDVNAQLLTSYLLMEKLFKIFVYKEGEPPLFHDGPCKNIYSTEGLFINLIETDHTNFTTRNPDEAHVYFLPFSVVRIVHYLFLPLVRDKAVLERTIVDYVSIISHKYPFWNRSLGADHFMLSCHDWGPRATWYEKKLYYNSIRVLCNANTSENFNPKKDVSFPEINLPTGEIPSDSKDSSLLEKSNNRSFLAFFAGRMHGKIRPLLFKHWKDKDDAHVKVYETLPQGGVSYQEMMKKSKFCLCPSGHEVASPRIPEAIYADCVPVLISQDYVPPFSDILNWEAFSVQVSVEEIHNLKSILMAIPEERYLELVNGVRQVRRHFEQLSHILFQLPDSNTITSQPVWHPWRRRIFLTLNHRSTSTDHALVVFYLQCFCLLLDSSLEEVF
ncbi:Probable glycosyltransferase At3g07620 [Linum grandiflorum]